MGEFNMPPGVSTRDIPGNRTEDLVRIRLQFANIASRHVYAAPTGLVPDFPASEALYEKLEEIVGDIGEERMNALHQFAEQLYAEGYKTAMDECRMAVQMEEK